MSEKRAYNYIESTDTSAEYNTTQAKCKKVCTVLQRCLVGKPEWEKVKIFMLPPF